MQKRYLYVFFFLFLGALPAFAADPVSQCSVIYHSKSELLLSWLDKIEHAYSDYRWMENKIRRLYYGALWQARQNGNDPLSHEKRLEGKREEEYLRKELGRLEKQSEEARKTVFEQMDFFQAADATFHSGCEAHAYQQCIQSAFQPVYDHVETMQHHFDLVTEWESDYRRDVGLTAAGRQGFYPDDALEPVAKHKEYYWRFETEREPQRFEQDAKMADLVFQLRKILAQDFAGDNCCTECGAKVTEDGTE